MSAQWQIHVSWLEVLPAPEVRAGQDVRMAQMLDYALPPKDFPTKDMAQRAAEEARAWVKANRAGAISIEPTVFAPTGGR